MNFEDKLREAQANPFGMLKNKFKWTNFFYWLIDWKQRMYTNIPLWVETQVSTVTELDAVVNTAGWSDMTADRAIVEIQKWVVRYLQYVGDEAQYGVKEYWALATETYTNGKGDCDDGAVLMYVLARKAGIPAEKLLIACGDVEYQGRRGGHCYLLYRVSLFWYVMDWCYLPNTRQLQYRKPEVIAESGKVYKNTWFMFNELGSFGKIKR